MFSFVEPFVCLSFLKCSFGYFYTLLQLIHHLLFVRLKAGLVKISPAYFLSLGMAKPIYNGCPIDPEDSSERWTSTKVESNENYITGQRNWGYCNSKC